MDQSKLWPRGTICLTIAANIGEVAILGMNACFPDNVVGIGSNSESNEYIYYFLTTLQQQLNRKANAVAQKNINLKVLSEIEIPLPPLEEQKRIAAHLDALAERTLALEAAYRGEAARPRRPQVFTCSMPPSGRSCSQTRVPQ